MDNDKWVSEIASELDKDKLDADKPPRSPSPPASPSENPPAAAAVAQNPPRSPSPPASPSENPPAASVAPNARRLSRQKSWGLLSPLIHFEDWQDLDRLKDREPLKDDADIQKAMKEMEDQKKNAQKEELDKYFRRGESQNEKRYYAHMPAPEEEEEEVEAEREIPMLHLRPTTTGSIWLPPPNLRSPLTGIYHSGYPKDEHLPYLKSLGLKTILSLVEPKESPALTRFLNKEKINRIKAPMDKTSIWISRTRVRVVVDYLLRPELHPILVFSDQGKHRIGCVLGLLRKVTSDWSIETHLREYKKLAGGEAFARDEVITFILNIRPRGFDKYLKNDYESAAKDDVPVMPPQV